MNPEPQTIEDVAPVLVRACKYDGRLHRQWPARLLRHEEPLIVVAGVFSQAVHHPQLGLIARGTMSTEYFWTDRWYNVFRFAAPDGQLCSFYCNINLPPRFDGRTLTFVDLDIDVLVAPDFSYRILDEDEFAAHARRYQYPPAVRRGTRRALAQLLALITARSFPFTQT